MQGIYIDITKTGFEYCLFHVLQTHVIGQLSDKSNIGVCDYQQQQSSTLYQWMLLEMASCHASGATLENLGQGLFGVQLEVRESSSPYSPATPLKP